jgi:GNAT superfamily N-acetyltransferase
MKIRELRADELDFLRAMLVAAIDWRGDGSLPPSEVVLQHPAAAMYHSGWGRLGDVALAADEDGRAIGASWCRLFTEAEHGAGFHDATTPEVAIAVVEDARGRGVGRALLEAMHERLRGEGVRRVSLSVDLDNPAKCLYERLGYAEVQPGDPKGLMLLDL